MFEGRPTELRNAIAQIIAEECHGTQCWDHDDFSAQPHGNVTPAELWMIRVRAIELLVMETDRPALVCPQCQNTIFGDADSFCYLCGSKGVGVPACECGRKLARQDRFCPRCGRKVGEPAVRQEDGRTEPPAIEAPVELPLRVDPEPRRADASAHSDLLR